MEVMTFKSCEDGNGITFCHVPSNIFNGYFFSKHQTFFPKNHYIQSIATVMTGQEIPLHRASLCLSTLARRYAKKLRIFFSEKKQQVNLSAFACKTLVSYVSCSGVFFKDLGSTDFSGKSGGKILPFNQQLLPVCVPQLVNRLH